jgi:hypothetical protein
MRWREPFLETEREWVLLPGPMLSPLLRHTAALSGQRNPNLDARDRGLDEFP